MLTSHAGEVPGCPLLPVIFATDMGISFFCDGQEVRHTYSSS